MAFHNYSEGPDFLGYISNPFKRFTPSEVSLKLNSHFICHISRSNYLFLIQLSANSISNTSIPFNSLLYR